MSRAAAARIFTVAAFAAALAAAPRDALHAWRDVRNGSEVPRAERALAPALQVGIEAPGAFVRAAAVVPPEATYFVLAGERAPLRDARARDYLNSWAAFTLLPRRRADHVDEADWVVSYGGDLRTLRVPFRRIVDLGAGVRVAEIAR